MEVDHEEIILASCQRAFRCRAPLGLASRPRSDQAAGKRSWIRPRRREAVRSFAQASPLLRIHPLLRSSPRGQASQGQDLSQLRRKPLRVRLCMGEVVESKNQMA